MYNLTVNFQFTDLTIHVLGIRGVRAGVLPLVVVYDVLSMNRTRRIEDSWDGAKRKIVVFET